MTDSEGMKTNGYKWPVESFTVVKTEQEQIGDKILSLSAKGIPITEAADIVLGK